MKPESTLRIIYMYFNFTFDQCTCTLYTCVHYNCDITVAYFCVWGIHISGCSGGFKGEARWTMPPI